MAHNVTSPLRRKVIEAFQRYRTPLNMGIELPTIEAIKRFVAMGNGVALVPHLTVAQELEAGDLVRVPVDELEMRRVLRLVHRRQATLSYAGKAFLRHPQGAGAGNRGRHFIFMWNGRDKRAIGAVCDPAHACRFAGLASIARWNNPM